MKSDQLSVQLPDWASVVIVCLIFLLANATMGAMPVLFGAYIDHLDYSIEVAGRVATAETAGLALGSTLCLALLGRTRAKLKTVIVGSLFVLLLAQLLSGLTSEAISFGMARGLSGVCVGLVQSAGSAWIAGLKRPDRPFALYVGMSFLSGAVGMPLFSMALGSIGLSHLYFGYAAVIALTILIALCFPEARKVTHDPTGDDRGGPKGGRQISLLVGVTLNFAVNGGVWIYLERAGHSAQLDPSVISATLSAGMIAALATTFAIAAIGDRAGRLTPTIVAHVMLILSTSMLVFVAGFAWFATAVIIFHIAFAIVPPYVMAALSAADSSGRAALRGVAAINIGYCVAPLLFTNLVTSLGQRHALIVAALAFGVCLALAITGLARRTSSDARRSNATGIDPAP